MKGYIKLLEKIINEGIEKESGRENMPNTYGISHATIAMDLKNGFPLLTTKKMYWKGIVHELLWFLRGETNIKYLVDNNVNIWNSDAYRWYLKYANSLEEPDYDYHVDDPNQQKTRVMTEDEFISAIKGGNLGSHKEYKLGDLGKVYGYQWRNQNGVDQINDIIVSLKNNPYSRYHILDGWNKADFPEMALPPCHLLYQFIVTPLSGKEREKIAIDKGISSYKEYEEMVGSENAEKEYFDRVLNQNKIPKFYLDVNMYQRSADTFLGVPFNLASMSLLLTIIAKTVNMIPNKANWIGGDTHLYVSHLPQVKEQLDREPFELPKVVINKELNNIDDIINLSVDDIKLIDYKSHPKLKAELFTGLKK